MQNRVPNKRAFLHVCFTPAYRFTATRLLTPRMEGRFRVVEWCSSDGGIFAASAFWRALQAGTLDLHHLRTMWKTWVTSVSDQAFLLTQVLLLIVDLQVEAQDSPALQEPGRIGSHRSSQGSLAVWKKFTAFFLSAAGQVALQNNVLSCQPDPHPLLLLPKKALNWQPFTPEVLLQMLIITLLTQGGI